MEDFELTVPFKAVKNVLLKIKSNYPKQPWRNDTDELYFETTDVIRELFGGFYKMNTNVLPRKNLLNTQIGVYLGDISKKEKSLGLICLYNQAPTKDDINQDTTTLCWTFDTYHK